MLAAPVRATTPLRMSPLKAVSTMRVVPMVSVGPAVTSAATVKVPLVEAAMVPPLPPNVTDPLAVRAALSLVSRPDT